MEFKSTARPSPISGTWYSSDPNTLSRQIDDYIARAELSKDEIKEEVIGLVSPHAGHQYSGKTAGYAYKTILNEKRSLVVLLSPFHQYLPGDLITSSYGAYETPLGEIPVNTQLMNKLEQSLKQISIPIDQISHDPEHSLEIQLPFLQRTLVDDFQLMPLMVRSKDVKILNKVAAAIYEVIRKESYIVIASTDLSHFLSLDKAEKMDAEMMRLIEELDPKKLLDAEKKGSASACGASAVAVMLWIAELAGAKKSFILNYSTSANVTGDTSSVVGYAAAAIVR